MAAEDGVFSAIPTVEIAPASRGRLIIVQDAALTPHTAVGTAFVHGNGAVPSGHEHPILDACSWGKGWVASTDGKEILVTYKWQLKNRYHVEAAAVSGFGVGCVAWVTKNGEAGYVRADVSLEHRAIPGYGSYKATSCYTVDGLSVLGEAPQVAVVWARKVATVVDLEDARVVVRQTITLPQGCKIADMCATPVRGWYAMVYGPQTGMGGSCAPTPVVDLLNPSRERVEAEAARLKALEETAGEAVRESEGADAGGDEGEGAAATREASGGAGSTKDDDDVETTADGAGKGEEEEAQAGGGGEREGVAAGGAACETKSETAADDVGDVAPEAGGDDATDNGAKGEGGTAVPPSAPPAPTLDDINVFAHNALRVRHGTPLVVADPVLSEHAQTQADICLDATAMMHGNCKEYGEGQNIYMAKWSGFEGHPDEQYVRNACQSWYDEVTLYNEKGGGLEGMQNKAGHFTQLVWRESLRVGLGLARADGMIVIVVNYAPAGNLAEDAAIRANVGDLDVPGDDAKVLGVDASTAEVIERYVSCAVEEMPVVPTSAVDEADAAAATDADAGVDGPPSADDDGGETAADAPVDEMITLVAPRTTPPLHDLPPIAALINGSLASAKEYKTAPLNQVTGGHETLLNAIPKELTSITSDVEVALIAFTADAPTYTVVDKYPHLTSNTFPPPPASLHCACAHGTIAYTAPGAVRSYLPATKSISVVKDTPPHGACVLRVVAGRNSDTALVLAGRKQAAGARPAEGVFMFGAPRPQTYGGLSSTAVELETAVEQTPKDEPLEMIGRPAEEVEPEGVLEGDADATAADVAPASGAAATPVDDGLGDAGGAESSAGAGESTEVEEAPSALDTPAAASALEPTEEAQAPHTEAPPADEGAAGTAHNSSAPSTPQPAGVSIDASPTRSLRTPFTPRQPDLSQFTPKSRSAGGPPAPTSGTAAAAPTFASNAVLPRRQPSHSSHTPRHTTSASPDISQFVPRSSTAATPSPRQPPKVASPGTDMHPHGPAGPRQVVPTLDLSSCSTRHRASPSPGLPADGSGVGDHVAALSAHLMASFDDLLARRLRPLEERIAYLERLAVRRVSPERARPRPHAHAEEDMYHRTHPQYAQHAAHAAAMHRLDPHAMARLATQSRSPPRALGGDDAAKLLSLREQRVRSNEQYSQEAAASANRFSSFEVEPQAVYATPRGHERPEHIATPTPRGLTPRDRSPTRAPWR